MVAASLAERIESIALFLSQPLVCTLFEYHPNDLGQSSFNPPPEWDAWWNWAGGEPEGEGEDDPWLLLLRYYNYRLCGLEPTEKTSSIPHVLRLLIDDATRLALPRDLGHVYPTGAGTTTLLKNYEPQTLPGMSPKKAHEVVQMVGFLETMLSSQSSLGNIHHVVDIGAGQAYVSRSLRDKLNLHVLALDWSEIQKQGATRKDASKTARRTRSQLNEPPSENACGQHAGSMTYVTTKIDADTLISATDSWLDNRLAMVSKVKDGVHEVTPVLLIGLHACGSLTTDILRAFLSTRTAGSSSHFTSWTPHGAVIVGCCYNLMRSEDFPLSQTVHSCSVNQALCLHSSHLQLAAQVPSQWLRSEQSLYEARLSMRKVTWRALLEDSLRELQGDEISEISRSKGNDHAPRILKKRLGRLSDQVFTDWETFNNAARKRLPHLRIASKPPSWVERRIEVMHMLRCLVGPVVEACILLDRLAWISEELQEKVMSVGLVNIFDQACGSGRNIAIVIHPCS